MIRRLFAGIGALLLALCLALAAAGSTPTKTFRDRPGDVAGGAGPDITAIRVSHSEQAVTFTVRFAKAPPLGACTKEKWVDMLLVGIDVPPLGPAPKPTGWRGVNYFFGLHGTDTVVRFGKMGRQGLTRLQAVVRGATITVTVPRAKLGSPPWFAFNLAAGRETDVEEQGGSDYAPARGSFRYVLTG